MLSRHAQTAIGGSRPIAQDLVRVSEGIAASLRAFSSSVRRSEGEDGKLYVSLIFLGGSF